MPLFYLRTFYAYLALRTTSVLLHYMGPSPWGGPLILSPDRFIPEAWVIEGGIWALCAGLGASIEWALGRTRPSRPPRIFRAGFLAFCVFLAIFSQVDFEVVRWLGQHMTASYVANFAGARDGQLFTRILSADILFSSLALLQICCAAVVAIALFLRFGKNQEKVNRKLQVGFLVFLPLALASPHWLRPSEKRWRRLQPASIGIAQELVFSMLGTESPKDEQGSHQDLIDFVITGELDRNVTVEDPAYPLYRDSNVGSLSPSEHKKLPLEERPDVVVLVFETMRGINTGFLGEKNGPLAAMPKLRTLIQEEALYFPKMHSAGYPSVEGALGIHLGMWPHHTRIVFSSFLHINSVAFPEMLRNAGYETHALLGADPSFSNFTPWFRRWYESIEYDPDNHHDGPLVDRFIEIHEAKVGSEKPLLSTLWTATTHPPYDVPKETGITPADTTEARYLQAMQYSDEQLHRLILHLKSSPRWDHTLVFLLGDHSQPTPWQWTHQGDIGELNPGHTWTSLAILGGKNVAPAPRRDERPVSHVDLGPTILSAINLRHKNHFFGRDLLGRATNAPPQAEPRPVLAFRYGTISHEHENRRTLFHINGQEALSYSFEASDLKAYGGLQGGHLEPTKISIDVDRYRDMARAWAQLLDENRVAPAHKAITQARQHP